MGLIVGVRKNDVFYVEDKPVKVKDLTGYVRAVLEVDGKEVTIYDDKQVEVLPRVFIQCGKPSQHVLERASRHVLQGSHDSNSNLVRPPTHSEVISRLVIEAPREITILRARLYERRGKKGVQNSSYGTGQGQGKRY